MSKQVDDHASFAVDLLNMTRDALARHATGIEPMGKAKLEYNAKMYRLTTALLNDDQETVAAMAQDAASALRQAATESVSNED